MSEKNLSDHESYLEKNREIWDKEALNFDQEADHGLNQSHVYAAWKTLLKTSLEGQALDILDIGCGTGSLSLLLADLGHHVIGVDLSPAMIERSKAKAEKAGQAIDFQVMDAAFPDFPAEEFDVILCRHLLWTLPEPRQVLQRWLKLLKPQGRLLLIEGFWHTGAGIKAKELLAMLPDSMTEPILLNLSEQVDLWGTPVSDERYLIRVKRNA